jgi:hypothetical protein
MLALIVLLSLYGMVAGFTPSPEFNALRGIPITSAKTLLKNDVSKLIGSNPTQSVLICFRSFG